MGGYNMTCLLYEEIRAIKHTIVYLKKGVVLESNTTKKEKMKREIQELDKLLLDKLNQCGDYIE